MSPNTERLFNWKFWLQWTLATTLGWLLGNAIFPEFSLGITIGLAQWLILRALFPRAAWWMLASAAGWLIGELSLLIIHTPQNETIAGAILGIWLGVLQWIPLRNWVPRSNWWVLISTLGWAIGFSGFVESALVGALVGAITGIGMELFVRYSKGGL